MATMTVEVDLDSISDEELLEEVGSRGLQTYRDDCDCDDAVISEEGSSGLPIYLEDRLSTLVLCGQREQAVQELSAYLAPHIGALIA